MPTPKRKPPSPPRPAKRAPRARAPTAAELPATRGMLGELRTELFERIDQAKVELKAEIHEVKAELKADIHRLEGRIDRLEASFDRLEAGLHEVKAELARVAFLVEEQNARNKVVLDGLMAMMDRPQRQEHRIDEVEATVRALASSHAAG